MCIVYIYVYFSIYLSIYSSIYLLYIQVIWHQSLLAFVQRYKFELNSIQKDKMKILLKVQVHHQITPEVRRELFVIAPSNHTDHSIAQSNYTPLTKISDDVEMLN